MSDDIEEAEVVEEHKSKAIEVARERSALATADELSIEQLLDQANKVKAAMKQAMTEDQHYGKIPGIAKPTLFKPGAEKLCVLFRLGPKYELEKVFEDNHLTVIATCSLIHIPTGNFVATGEGMCSTKESKYAYRNGSRKCPKCQAEAIIKGKQEYGGGWVCFKKKDGCGAKFDDKDQSIVGQQVGRIDNEDLPDSYNTVLKMACKRALIAAVLNGTAASDIFTQDIGDLDVAGSVTTEPEGAASAAPSPPSWFAQYPDEAIVSAGNAVAMQRQADVTIWTPDNLLGAPADFLEEVHQLLKGGGADDAQTVSPNEAGTDAGSPASKPKQGALT